MKAGETEVQQAERRAKARRKSTAADPYAGVPARVGGQAVTTAGTPAPPGVTSGPTPTRKSDRSDEATGRGRTAPSAPRPVSRSNASGRNQPSRKTRSKRGKR